MWVSSHVYGLHKWWAGLHYLLMNIEWLIAIGIEGSWHMA